VGKSTLALYLSRCVKPAVGIVSLEDPPEVYGARILSPLAGVSSAAIFTGDVGDFQTMERLGNGLTLVGKQPMIAYAVGAPIGDVLSAIRTLATKHACKLIVVDYAQAVRFDVRADRRIAIADAVMQMKATAAKVGAALVVCSQLSRPPSDTKFREPMTHHLKESGDLENMAEAIVLLWQTSDKAGANVYGKVAKLKWGYAGHRFRFERDSIGNLDRCVPWDGTDLDNPTSSNGEKRWT
jgi:replicative DNA helicase